MNSNFKTGRRRRKERYGAVAVEFAISAVVLFTTLLTFFEFGRVTLIESFVENAAFEAARHVAVLGANTDEGDDLARTELSYLGIDNAEIYVEPLVANQVRSTIDVDTEAIRVRILVPLREATVFGDLFGDVKLEREAVIIAERVRLLIDLERVFTP